MRMTCHLCKKPWGIFGFIAVVNGKKEVLETCFRKKCRKEGKQRLKKARGQV